MISRFGGRLIGIDRVAAKEMVFEGLTADGILFAGPPWGRPSEEIWDVLPGWGTGANKEREREQARQLLAEAVYWSEGNVATCTRPEGPELLLATTRDWKQRKLLRERGCPRGRIPRGLSLREGMERKLLTRRGRGLYKMRGILVEPVLGQMKEGQGFRRFMRRGLLAARSEASLVATTHNLLKLWRSRQAPWGWARARWS